MGSDPTADELHVHPWQPSLHGYIPYRLSHGQAQCPPEADRESGLLFPPANRTQHLQGKVALPLPFLFDHTTRFSPLSVVFQSTQSSVLCLLSIFTIISSHIHISVATQSYTLHFNYASSLYVLHFLFISKTEPSLSLNFPFLIYS